MNLSQSPNRIHAIFVPEVKKEPWLKRPLDATFSSLMLIVGQWPVTAVSYKLSA
jgi:hypothetical protein